MPGMYTWGEVFGIASHAVKGSRQVLKNGHESADGGHGDRSDRIHDKALERRERQAAIAFNALENAEDTLARAEYALSTAKGGPEKAAARRARNDAKQKLNRANAAARKFR